MWMNHVPSGMRERQRERETERVRRRERDTERPRDREKERERERECVCVRVCKHTMCMIWSVKEGSAKAARYLGYLTPKAHTRSFPKIQTQSHVT